MKWPFKSKQTEPEPLPKQDEEIYDTIDKTVGLDSGTAKEMAYRERVVILAEGYHVDPAVFQSGGLIESRHKIPAGITPPETAHGVPLNIVHDEMEVRIKDAAEAMAVPFKDLQEALRDVSSARGEFKQVSDVYRRRVLGIFPTDDMNLGAAIHMMLERSFDKHSRRVYNRLHHPNTRVARGQKRFCGRMVRLDRRSGYCV